MRYFIKPLAWFFLLVLAAAALAYAAAGFNEKELDELAQNEMGGSYLSTQYGVISYSRVGAKDAPAVILVHGFSTPKFVWEPITPFLVAAGYQVIAFDHLGRGFSERPQVRYDAQLYRSELADLIDGLQIKKPLALVGYSMGGANVVDYAALYPEQVKQLILIAPAGYMGANKAVGLLRAPVIGEWFARVFGNMYSGAAIKAAVDDGFAPPNMLNDFQQQASFSGYTDALLSTVRYYPMGDFAHRYRSIGEAGIPVSAIWGTDDAVVPFAGVASMARDVPQLKVHKIEGGKHNMTYVKPQEVAREMLLALEKYKKLP